MGIKRLTVVFFVSESGREPVRDWLRDLDRDDRKAIGEDIRLAEMEWPIGMPTCRSLAGFRGLREIRTNISDGRIARVVFAIDGSDMVLLHGFVKKSQKTPSSEIQLAQRRWRQWQDHDE